MPVPTAVPPCAKKYISFNAFLILEYNLLIEIDSQRILALETKEWHLVSEFFQL